MQNMQDKPRKRSMDIVIGWIKEGIEMKRKIDRVTGDQWDTLIETMNHAIKNKQYEAEKRYMFEERMHQYHEELLEVQKEKFALAIENEHLKTLFDKEGDTQIIKYNGKLYRITSTSHFHDVGEADTLDINAVRVSEVG